MFKLETEGDDRQRYIRWRSRQWCGRGRCHLLDSQQSNRLAPLPGIILIMTILDQSISLSAFQNAYWTCEPFLLLGHAVFLEEVDSGWAVLKVSQPGLDPLLFELTSL